MKFKVLSFSVCFTQIHTDLKSCTELNIVNNCWFNSVIDNCAIRIRESERNQILKYHQSLKKKK